MISLSQEVEALARRIAEAHKLTVEDAIRQALVEKARASGLASEPLRPRRRQSVEEMLSVGAEIAAMPVLDPRTANEIMDDINAL